MIFRNIATTQDQLTSVGKSMSVVHKQQELAFRALLEKHQQAQGQAAERTWLERRRKSLADDGAASDFAAPPRDRSQNQLATENRAALSLSILACRTKPETPNYFDLRPSPSLPTLRFQ